MSIVHLLCGRISIAVGSDITSVWTVSRHLIQVGFSSVSVIPPSLNNLNRCCVAGKDKDHRPASINKGAIFIVLSSIPSLQAFDPIVIASFFEIVVIFFSNMESETHFKNTDLNGLKTATSNGWIKWVALAGNRTNMTLIPTDFFKFSSL